MPKSNEEKSQIHHCKTQIVDEESQLGPNPNLKKSRNQEESFGSFSLWAKLNNTVHLSTSPDFGD
jgi:hypothetical protein